MYIYTLYTRYIPSIYPVYTLYIPPIQALYDLYENLGVVLLVYMNFITDTK